MTIAVDLGRKATKPTNQPMLYIKYLAIHKVQMHAGARRKLLYGLCICTSDNPLAKARGLSSRTDAQTMQYNLRFWR